MAHRQTYVPRLWPVVVLTVAVVAACLWVFDIRGTWPGALLGLVVGGVLMQLRWFIWRRRHPELSVEEYLEMVRRAAPYN